jgi:hypothetical protein
MVSDGDSLEAWLQIISETFEISIEILPEKNKSGRRSRDNKDFI